MVAYPVLLSSPAVLRFHVLAMRRQGSGAGGGDVSGGDQITEIYRNEMNHDETRLERSSFAFSGSGPSILSIPHMSEKHVRRLRKQPVSYVALTPSFAFCLQAGSWKELQWNGAMTKMFEDRSTISFQYPPVIEKGSRNMEIKQQHSHSISDLSRLPFYRM